jgi:hypothetical protein
MKSVFRIIEKLFALLVFLPPVYMVYRFVRWYLKQREPEEVA